MTPEEVRATAKLMAYDYLVLELAKKLRGLLGNDAEGIRGFLQHLRAMHPQGSLARSLGNGYPGADWMEAEFRDSLDEILTGLEKELGL